MFKIAESVFYFILLSDDKKRKTFSNRVLANGICVFVSKQLELFCYKQLLLKLQYARCKDIDGLFYRTIKTDCPCLAILTL